MMKVKRVMYLLGGFAMLLCLGLIYAWSVFIKPLEAEFGWLRSQTSMVFTISMSFFCIGGIGGSLISKKKSPRLAARISAGCMLVGFLGASQIDSLGGIYIFYGVLCGFGVGLGYNAVLGLAAKWFPDKPGFYSGILLMGFGFGGMLLGAIATAQMNTIGWRDTFKLFGVGFAALLVAGAQCLKEPTEKTGCSPDLKKAQKADEKIPELDCKQMLSRPSFWLCFLWSIILSAIGLAVIGHAVPNATIIGATMAVATAATGMISVCNGLSRILFGCIFDVLGIRKTMMIISMLFLVSISIVIASILMTNVLLLIVGYIFIGMSYGGVPLTNAYFVLKTYGPKNYAINFSIMVLNILPASLLGPGLASEVYVKTGMYLNVFYILFALCIVAGIIGMIIKRP